MCQWAMRNRSGERRRLVGPSLDSGVVPITATAGSLSRAFPVKCVFNKLTS